MLTDNRETTILTEEQMKKIKGTWAYLGKKLAKAWVSLEISFVESLPLTIHAKKRILDKLTKEKEKTEKDLEEFINSFRGSHAG